MSLLGGLLLYRERDLPDVVEHGLSVLHCFGAEARNAFVAGLAIAFVLGIAVAVGTHLL